MDSASNVFRIFTGGKWAINKSEENEKNLRIMNPHPNFKDKGALSILSWMLVGLFNSVLFFLFKF